MRRIIVTLLVGALLAATPISGWAVDKKQKEDPPKAAPRPTPPAPAKDSAKKQQPKAKQAKPTEGKKYDNFVDSNNNGIDDRLEKDKKKPDK